jgi:hypothetical protein
MPDSEAPRLLMILTENHTLVDGRDLRGLVGLAQVAEESGFDAVMVSEQTMLSGDAARNGLMSNPRMYAAIGNQDPLTPWPSSVATLAAVAAATQRVRIVAGAIIPPLRHPLLLAKDLATIDLLCEGRLVVQPTVSWQEAEYDAHGIPFHRRGAILDEHLAAMSALWADSPASFAGEFFRFDGLVGRRCGSAESGCTPPWYAAWCGTARVSTRSVCPPTRTWPCWPKACPSQVATSRSWSWSEAPAQPSTARTRSQTWNGPWPTSPISSPAATRRSA